MSNVYMIQLKLYQTDIHAVVLNHCINHLAIVFFLLDHWLVADSLDSKVYEKICFLHRLFLPVLSSVWWRAASTCCRVPGWCHDPQSHLGEAYAARCRSAAGVHHQPTEVCRCRWRRLQLLHPVVIPRPKENEMQQFLADYFCRFIPNFVELTSPLTNLTQKNASKSYRSMI